MQLLALLSVAVMAITATAAPLEKRGLSCATTLTGFSTMQCNCLATCVANDNCCDDYESFHSAAVATLAKASSISQADPLNGGRLAPFHKIEPAVMAAAGAQGKNAIVTVRNCVYEDVLKVRAPAPGQVAPTVMPKWEVRGCSAAFDVLGYTAKGQFVSFTQVVKVPQRVRVAVGPKPPGPNEKHIMPVPAPWNTFFFAELTGDSAVAAVKQAVSSAELVPTFTAKLPKVASGKASFDTTPRRNWKVESATFTTARNSHGMIIPETNISALDLDRDYAETARNAGYWANPSSGFVRKIHDGKQWADLLSKNNDRVVVDSFLA